MATNVDSSDYMSCSVCYDHISHPL